MQLTKAEVFGLESVLNSLMEVKLEPETSFKVASNVILASEFVTTIRKSYQVVDGYDEIQKERSELIASAGGELQPNGSFTLPANKAKKIGEEIEKFNTEHKEILDAQNEYQTKFDEMLQKIVEIDFKTIGRKELTAAIEPGKLVLMIQVGMLTDGDK